MQKRRHTRLIICLVVMGVLLSGCDKARQERDDALAEAAAAKAELAKVKTELAEVKDDLAKAKTNIAAAADEKNALQAEVAKLTADLAKTREAGEKTALNSLNILAKMQEQEKLIGQYEKQIQDLQAKVKELTDKLTAAGVITPNP